MDVYLASNTGKNTPKIVHLFSIDHKIKSHIYIIEIIASLQSLLLQLLSRTMHNSKILKTQMFSLLYFHVLFMISPLLNLPELKNPLLLK